MISALPAAPRRLVPARLGAVQPARVRAAATPVRMVRPATWAAPVAAGLGFRHRILITLTLVGALVALAGPGSLAGFNAQTQSAAGLQTGTILLDNTQNTGSDCVSAIGTSGTVTIPAADLNNGCTQFSVSGANALPGVALGPFSTRVKNIGGTAASVFSLYAGSACVDSATAGQPYNGGASLCNQIEMYVQQYSDAGFTTPYTCVYGAGSPAASCTGFDSTHTMGAFASTYTSASPITLRSPSTTGLGSGVTTYFRIYVSFPTTSIVSGVSDLNAFQGQTADVKLTWYLQQ